MNQPENLDEAVSTLEAALSTQDRELLKRSDPSEFHHGLGRGIRNSFNLWSKDSILVQWFEQNLGIVHADDLSGTIMASLCSKLRGEPFNPTEHVIKYKEHWKRMGHDPMSV